MNLFNKTFYKIIFVAIGAITILDTGCKQLVDVEAPITSTNSELAYKTDADAASVLTGIYIAMSQSSIRSTDNLMSVSLFAGLSADELDLFPGGSGINDQNFVAFYRNRHSNAIAGLTNYWSKTYNMIYTVNAAIQGLSASTTLTPTLKQQLLGEAKFLRAFFYFYLVNLYGDVPLNITTDYKANAVRPRTDKGLVYQQIITDLKEAKELLFSDYRTFNNTTTQERVRPNKFAASALLARAYLFLGEYANAETEAGFVIANSGMYDLVPTEEVFLKNSQETIWAIKPVELSNITNTSEADFFVPNDGDLTVGNFVVTLSEHVMDKLSATDVRRLNWVSEITIGSKPYYYPFKYKNDLPNSPVVEYPIVLRLAEQYLIRSEARARQGKLTGANSAESDLNVIRLRAKINVTTAANSQESMLQAIMDERQRELFTEWGHRWLDLKRIGIANEVLAPIKGADWQTSDQLYLIPQVEIDRNPSLKAQQNPAQ